MPRDLMAPYPHPGKYEGEPLLAEKLDELDPDEELGDVEGFGNYRLYLGLTSQELGGNIGRTKAAILHTDSQGFVSGEYFNSDAAAKREWQKIEEEYEEGGGFDDEYE